MALTFPRAMPSAGAEKQRLSISRIDYATPETGGRMTGVSAGFPLWKFELQLGQMGDDDANVWVAFVDSLRGVGRSFFARDLKRAYPQAHPGGKAGFAGQATSWSVNGTRDVLTLNLPAGAAGLTLKVGDLIGFSWTTSAQPRRTIARVTEGGVYAAGALPVSIEPPLPSLVPGSAVASVYNAEIIARLIPGETELGAEDSIETDGGRIVALQDLRA